MLFEVIMLALSYVVGSIPSGFIVARFAGVRDIRNHGSGNIGATNVARTLGYKYFFIVFFADFFKAYVFLHILAWNNVLESLLFASALALLIGNGASFFLKFRGGKGIATMFGILCALTPIVLPYLLGIWLSILLITRTVGVASVAALISLPFLIIFLNHPSLFISMIMLSMSILGVYWHRENISSFVNLNIFYKKSAIK